MTTLAIAVAVFCAIWWIQIALVARNLSGLHDLAQLAPPDPARWPRVSTIVPARDEAAGMPASLSSRLADGYPDLELIVVDDRSTDDTPRILAEFAARDSRVLPVRVDVLPHGWLGKVHALDEGVKRATGEWLLFSDADVELEPGTLARAVAHCEAEGVDALALLPEFGLTGGLADAAMGVFARVLTMAVDPRAVRDPRSKVAAGAGAFTLVSRPAYHASPGFEHLRLETADDVALGVMLKASGARVDFLGGRHAARVVIYDSLASLMRGIEKNGSSLARTPFPLMVLAFALIGCLEYSPFVALLLGLYAHVSWLAALGEVTLLGATVATVAPLWRNNGEWLAGLLFPLGWAIMAFGMLRSAWLAHRRGGVVWRGTFHPIGEVLEAQRFHLG